MWCLARRHPRRSPAAAAAARSDPESSASPNIHTTVYSIHNGPHGILKGISNPEAMQWQILVGLQTVRRGLGIILHLKESTHLHYKAAYRRSGTDMIGEF